MKCVLSLNVSRDLSTKLSRFVLDKNDIVIVYDRYEVKHESCGSYRLIDKSDLILNQGSRITVNRKTDILDYYLFYYTNSKGIS